LRASESNERTFAAGFVVEPRRRRCAFVTTVARSCARQDLDHRPVIGVRSHVVTTESSPMDTDTTLADIADHLARVEKSNRRLRLALGAVVVAASAGVLGAAAWQDSRSVVDEVRAKRFVVVNDRGTEMGSFELIRDESPSAQGRTGEDVLGTRLRMIPIDDGAWVNLWATKSAAHFSMFGSYQSMGPHVQMNVENRSEQLPPNASVQLSDGDKCSVVAAALDTASLSVVDKNGAIEVGRGLLSLMRGASWTSSRPTAKESSNPWRAARRLPPEAPYPRPPPLARRPSIVPRSPLRPFVGAAPRTDVRGRPRRPTDAKARRSTLSPRAIASGSDMAFSEACAGAEQNLSANGERRGTTSRNRDGSPHGGGPSRRAHGIVKHTHFETLQLASGPTQTAVY
jgi:hypothetical protein